MSMGILIALFLFSIQTSFSADGAPGLRVNRESLVQPSAPALTGIMFLQLQEFLLEGDYFFRLEGNFASRSLLRMATLWRSAGWSAS
jgi:hypothetical protein